MPRNRTRAEREVAGLVAVEVAIVRLTNAPPDEVDSIANELRSLYQWSAQDGRRLRETLESLQPKPEPTDPEEFDRG